MDLNASIKDIALPLRMQKLPVSDQGYPVPWFVHWIDGKPDFRVIGPDRMVRAYNEKRCWLCGDKLGAYLCFTIGPMCSVNQINSEPPSHLSCAQYAVRACPFLSKPRMRRNENDLPEGGNIAGVHLNHNPGATALWITKSYRPFAATGGTLFKLGDPVNVLWYAEGQPATRKQVLDALDKGLPTLRAMAAKEGFKAADQLERNLLRAMQWLPKGDDNARQVRPEEHDRQSVRGGDEDTASDRGTEPG